MATKFLTTDELNNLKEGIKMTELGTMIFNDGISQGIAQGIEQEAALNARNLFLNGISFQVVRDSIKSLSDAELRKIYDEVKINND